MVKTTDTEFGVQTNILWGNTWENFANRLGGGGRKPNLDLNLF